LVKRLYANQAYEEFNMLKIFVHAVLATSVVCAAAPAFADSSTPAKTVQTPNGAALVDANGVSLYTFDNDEGGKSNCSGQCAGIWPPFTAAADSSSNGDWAIIARDDGTPPLYAFANDAKPGDANGDEFNNVWHLAKP
jgi:predicted lipoprotein with Yx(FWY)xxD motif